MYTYTAIANSTSVLRSDGAIIPSNPTLSDWQNYQDWLTAGNVPASAPIPPAPIPTCQVWQLRAVLTVAQWTTIQNTITAQNNPALTAFAAQGNNPIPANSTTLISLGAAIGLTPAQVTALVIQAAAVAIP